MILAGTGHRPKYCPCKYDDNHPWLSALRGRIANVLKVNNISMVITGMAIGFDTWLAEEAMKQGLEIHAYIPFEGQSRTWPTKSKLKYQEIIKYSSQVNFFEEEITTIPIDNKEKVKSFEYMKKCFLLRDKAMIDNADLVISLLDPKINHGGTFYTVNYAKKNNKPIINVWE